MSQRAVRMVGMRDIVTELANLFMGAPLPIPSAVGMADESFAKECGINIALQAPAAPACGVAKSCNACHDCPDLHR
jgi:hypothetical protein